MLGQHPLSSLWAATGGQVDEAGSVSDRSALWQKASSSYANRRLRLRFYALLASLDASCIIVGITTAAWFRFGNVHHPQVFALIFVMLPIFWLLCGQGYSADALAKWRHGVGPALSALVITAVLVAFFSFIIKASEMSRLLLLLSIIFSSFYMVVARALVGQLARKVFGGAPLTNIFISDSSDMTCPSGYRMIDAQAFGLDPRVAGPHFLDRLGTFLSGVDNALVACLPERRAAWATALKGSSIRAALTIPELDAIGGIGVMHIDGIATMLVSTGPLAFRDRVAKRSLDLAISVPAILFLTPLMMLIAAAIKLDSRGPVFFTQQRVGRGNRLFQVFKFRSMRSDLCDIDGTTSASHNDHRITRVGRFIRATSIDELPQLFNILRGEMSFVGPRPHALGSLAGDQLFWEVDPRYTHRHACKPGLTGLAQVRGFRGATHRREDLINRLHADLEYMNGWKLSRDLAILVSTVKVVIHRNAF